MGIREALMAVKTAEACEHCMSDWIELADRVADRWRFDAAAPLWKTLNAKSVPLKHWTKLNIECPNCAEILALGDLLVFDQEAFRQEIVATVSVLIGEANIAECEYCNSGEIWYEYVHGDPLNLTYVSDLMDEYEVPADLRSDIRANLRCSNCGNGFDGDDKPYLTARALNDWYGDLEDTLVQTFNLDRWETRDFYKFLVRFPMLGLSHSVGQKIRKSIREKQVPGFVTLTPGHLFHRARARDPQQTPDTYADTDMWAPPLGRASHGRFNPIGVPVLYLGDTPKTCASEVRTDSNSACKIDVAQFVLLRPVVVWDLRRTDLQEFVSALSAPTEASSSDYAFSNFLSQCCAEAGVAGIAYASVKEESGVNTAFLHYEPDRTLGVSTVITMR